LSEYKKIIIINYSLITLKDSLRSFGIFSFLKKTLARSLFGLVVLVELLLLLSLLVCSEESDLARSFPLPLPVVAVVVVPVLVSPDFSPCLARPFPLPLPVVAVVVIPVLVSPDFSPCLVERLVVLMPLVRLPFLVSVVVGPMTDVRFLFYFYVIIRDEYRFLL